MRFISNRLQEKLVSLMGTFPAPWMFEYTAFILLYAATTIKV